MLLGLLLKPLPEGVESANKELIPTAYPPGLYYDRDEFVTTLYANDGTLVNSLTLPAALHSRLDEHLVHRTGEPAPEVVQPSPATTELRADPVEQISVHRLLDQLITLGRRDG